MLKSMQTQYTYITNRGYMYLIIKNNLKFCVPICFSVYLPILSLKQLQDIFVQYDPFFKGHGIFRELVGDTNTDSFFQQGHLLGVCHFPARCFVPGKYQVLLKHEFQTSVQ